MTDDVSAGVPEAALERLAEVRRRDGAFFTSDLSVQELLLARQSGFRSLSQVMGSCFYHVGWQFLPRQGSWWTPSDGQTVELDQQTEAWNEARRLALERLAEEARAAGADAVVGVRVERGAYDRSQGVLEFVATGTAVRSERYDLGGEPVLSNLSGQEFAKLYAHGYWPAGLVAASTVCYVVTGLSQARRSGGFMTSWQNQELPDYTRGFYDARAQAMLRVTRQAHELEASGVVGVRIDREVSEREREVNNQRFVDLIVTIHVLGTAIVEVASAAEPPPVYIALPLEEDR